MSGRFPKWARYNFAMRIILYGFSSKSFAIALLTLTLSGAASFADKLVEPDKVAPEFRDAAEKRRAEQLAIMNCNNAAKMANILARDQLKFISDCVDKATATSPQKPSDISSSTKK